MADEDKFIEGIFNYCDRWCERCPRTDCCRVFYEENRKRKEHVLAGEDPDDWNVVVQDVEESLQDAIGMIQEMAEEKGIDLVHMEPDEDPIFKIDLKQYPIHRKAHHYAKECHRFLDRFCAHLQDVRVKGLESGELDEMEDSFQVLSWYHMQIPVKIDRALSGRSREKVLGSEGNSDSDGSAKVAFIGLSRSMDVLTLVYRWMTPAQNEMMPLLGTVYELIEALEQEFPGYKTFKRPGFDD
jgi:hypothetical protein